MTLTRRAVLGTALASPLLMLARPLRAAEPEVFSDGGLAIRGADPVAYFRTGAPAAGDPALSLMWRGTTWQFATAENRADFEMDPEAYAPRFGGYCAYAMSRGYIATSVPEAWTIHEGRLYLNFSLEVRELWLRDVPGHIAAAEGHWPGVLSA